jgi:hypothetical protein
MVKAGLEINNMLLPLCCWNGGKLAHSIQRGQFEMLPFKQFFLFLEDITKMPNSWHGPIDLSRNAVGTPYISYSLIPYETRSS